MRDSYKPGNVRKKRKITGLLDYFRGSNHLFCTIPDGQATQSEGLSCKLKGKETVRDNETQIVGQ